LAWRGTKGTVSGPEFSRAERESWRMPALVLLERPRWSAPRRIAMMAMGAYLVVAVALLAVKAVQLALGH
jgi:hypothetical protein